MKILNLPLILGFTCTSLLEGIAQEPPVRADELKALRSQIEELQQKVKKLESKQSIDTSGVTNGDQRYQDLDQKVRVLERNRELEQEAASERAKEAPKISIGGDGFSFGTGDGDFKVQLKGVLQVDSRTFFDDAGITGNDSLLLRRVRPILQGTVYKDFDFLFVPDFGPSGGPQIFDSYINYRLSSALQFQAGKYKVPVGLEYLQPDQYTLFNERGLPTYLVPGRDVGFELHGDMFDNRVSYAVGIFNGVGDGRNSSNVDIEDNKEFAGRLFLQPFKNASHWFEGFGFGVAGTYESMQGTNTAGLPQTTGGTLAGYNTEGQQQFFAFNPTNRSVVLAAGEHWRLSPQAYYFNGPFNLLGEYVISDQRVTRTGTGPQPISWLENTSWQVAAGWVLTGEDYSYNGGVIPRKPFRPLEGGWGALQLVGRYSELDIDRGAFPSFADPRTSARSAQAWSLGLNWYLNRNVTVKTSFTRTTYQGGGTGASVPGIVNKRPEEVLFTRVQLSF